LILCLLINGPGKDMSYTASTPAGKTVRIFLGISQTDSIDFIRWQLKIQNEKEFILLCSYGIGKPNTNGFINEKKAELKGAVDMSNNILTLSTNGKSLSMLMLNDNVIHILDEDGKMIVGNGGWSYTLNSMMATRTTDINLKVGRKYFKDSIVFEGRTPCRQIGELMDKKTRPECDKKKWLVSLYKDGLNAISGTYKIGGSSPRSGKWKLKQNTAASIIYSLDLNNGNTLDLLQADENIVYIMDGKGGLLVGDHDFSYSLNRRTN
jgi:hypothetical protein